MTSQFKTAMAKMQLLGQNRAKLIDCSDVRPKRNQCGSSAFSCLYLLSTGYSYFRSVQGPYQISCFVLESPSPASMPRFALPQTCHCGRAGAYSCSCVSLYSGLRRVLGLTIQHTIGPAHKRMTMYLSIFFFLSLGLKSLVR
jgi:hypothetical protein